MVAKDRIPSITCALWSGSECSSVNIFHAYLAVGDVCSVGNRDGRDQRTSIETKISDCLLQTGLPAISVLFKVVVILTIITVTWPLSTYCGVYDILQEGVCFVQPVPSYLTVVNVESTFGHPSHSSLWVWRLVGIKVVNVRSLISDLKVPNHTVTLQWKEIVIIDIQHNNHQQNAPVPCTRQTTILRSEFCLETM